MKKNLFLLTLLLTVFCTTQLNAKTRFGIKGGVVFENFRYEEADKELALENAAKWQVGIFSQKKMGLGFSFQPELLYTWNKIEGKKKGVKANDIHHFEVPLNLQWGPKLLFARPYIMAGPYFSSAINLKDISKDLVKRFDWGVGASAGIEIFCLQLSARYAWGLRNVSSEKDFDMNRNTFNVSIGILF